MIEFKNVSRDFGRGKILDGISFRIEPKECVCILGPGGSGKSVLMSMLIGVDAPTSGTVAVDGADLRAIPRPALRLFRRKTGVVFQDGKLLGGRTVFENIAMPLEICNADDAAMERRVNELLLRMNLTALRNALPCELSAGEQARTAIARAVAHSPLILVADEPFRNLNMSATRAAIELFRGLNAAGSTVIIMTSDEALAETMRARIIRLESGRIVGGAAAPAPMSQPAETPAESPKKLVRAHVEAIEKRRKVKVTAIRSGD